MPFTLHCYARFCRTTAWDAMRTHASPYINAMRVAITGNVARACLSSCLILWIGFCGCAANLHIFYLYSVLYPLLFAIKSLSSTTLSRTLLEPRQGYQTSDLSSGVRYILQILLIWQAVLGAEGFTNESFQTKLTTPNLPTTDSQKTDAQNTSKYMVLITNQQKKGQLHPDVLFT